MATVRKRISELTPLTSASLDTTIVGVDNGTTYKIELDTLADAVTNRVNTLDRSRLDSIESITSSFETKGRGILSGSVSYTSLTNIPQGIVSQSTDLSSLNQFTASISTASLVTAINNLNTFTASQSTSSLVNRLNVIESVSGSWITENETGSFLTSLNGAISGAGQIADLGFVTGSYAYLTEFNSLTQSFNIISGSVVNITNAVDVIQLNNTTASLNLFTQSIDGRVDNLENATSSYLTSLNGAISSSSQLTSSYDLRYTLSGSVQPLPSNLVSSSAQITAFGFISSSQTINTSSFATTGSNSFNGNQTITGSLIVSAVAVVNGGVTIPTASVITLTSGSSISVDASGAITGSLTGSVFGIGDVVTFSASVNSRILSGSAVAGTVSGSSQLTSSFDLRYLVTGSVTSSINALNTFTASQSTASLVTSITNLNSATSSYETKGRSIVSGSSQLTSSYDSRYSLSGSILTSFSQSVDSRLDNQEAFSSSLSTLANSSTKILDAFYTSATAWSGSYTGNGGTVKVEANFTIFSSTTGTKTFALYRDGVVVDSGSFYFNQAATHTVMPTLYYIGTNETGTHTYSVGHNATSDVNDSCNIVVTETFNSLNGGLATTGSNTYTGTNTFRGTTRFETVGGDEGGEIEFGVPQTNTSLSTRVVQDIFQNRLRIFDGNTNGVFIDLSKAPIGVAGEITWKASGIVNAGTFVQLDNIKATIPSSGNRALALVTTSGTISGYISAHYQGILGGSSGIAQSISLSTSTNTSIFGWNFGQQGDTSHYILRDDTNNRVYRFVVIIGGSYNNNFISIERLH